MENNLIRRSTASVGLRKYAERKAQVNGIEYANGILAAAVWIEGAVPAVDAVEERHGRWIHVKTHEMRDEHGGLVGEARCSECELYSTQISSYGRVGYLYCPRCGARMDGRREDGDASERVDTP